MERLATKRGWWTGAALVAAVALGSQSGCVSALATAMWVIKGTDVDAEYTGLRNKRIAVVCRPQVELEYSSSRAAEDLARQVGNLLRERVRGVTIVDPRQVAEWTDEHDWEDYVEVGKALKADMVLGIDLQQFTLLEGQTLYRGRGSAHIAVYDVAKGGEAVYQKTLPPTVYPPNVPVPTGDTNEDTFRRQFVAVFADAIGRRFYAHDSKADFAADSKSLSD